MKHIILLALGVAVGIVAGSPVASAQTDAELIERALEAAPGRAREGATVIKWNADYTYETIKDGSTPLVCYNRSDERDRRPFAVQCTVKANLDRVAQSRQFRAETANAEEERAMVGAAEENGTRVAPEFGSMFVSMNGDDQASAGTHTTIAVPDATTESLGLPDNGAQGGAWLMAAGTTTAHIMVPGR